MDKYRIVEYDSLTRRNQQENIKNKVRKNQKPRKIIIYEEKDREVKRSIKGENRKWIESIASTAEEAARRQPKRTLYRLTKKVCNERPKQSTAVLDKKGKLLSSND